MVRSRDEGRSISDIDFRMMFTCLFCARRFFQTPLHVDSQHFSFVDDLNFGVYLWGLDVHKKILGELDRCNAVLNELMAEGRVKEQVCLYARVCSNFPPFYRKAYPFFGAPPVNCCFSKNPQVGCNTKVQSPNSYTKAFFGAPKKVIIELWPTADKQHLLIGLKDQRSLKGLRRNQARRRLLRRLP